MPEQVSAHAVRVYRALSTRTWLTNREVADVAHVAPRTARHHTERLWKHGLVDRREVFGGYRYRLRTGHADYRELMDETAVVLGVPAAR